MIGRENPLPGKQLCRQDEAVIGIDNLNDYYGASSSRRGALRSKHIRFFIKADIADRMMMEEIFRAGHSTWL